VPLALIWVNADINPVRLHNPDLATDLNDRQLELTVIDQGMLPSLAGMSQVVGSMPYMDKPLAPARIDLGARCQELDERGHAARK